MTPSWDGKTERRQDDSSVRFSLLEKQASDNKESLVAVHKRITQLDHETKYELRTGIQTIIDKIDEHEKTRALQCSDHSSRLVKVEGTIGWLDRWMLALSAGYVTAIGWAFHLQDKK